MKIEEFNAWLGTKDVGVARARTQSRPATPVRSTPAAARTRRLLSSRWATESIVFLVTTTHCACGAVHTQTNPFPMVRRYHPVYGVHEEALSLSHHALSASAGRAGLPVIREDSHVLIKTCHECLDPQHAHASAPELLQLDLFCDDAYAHSPTTLER